MDLKTAKKLNNLNIQFYQKVSSFFDSSRKYNWKGWENPKLVDTLRSLGDLQVLDLGCGNGRFLDALKVIPQINVENYTGLDITADLLDKAKENYKEGAVDFKQVDILFDEWEKDREGKYNLIVSFGVLHHIPSNTLRQELFERVSKALSKGGVFIFTIWNFAGNGRQKNKILPKSRYKEFGLEGIELEEGDYILTWNRGVEAVRYSHSYSDEEVAELIRDNGFELVDSFLSDGKEGDLNKYFVCGVCG